MNTGRLEVAVSKLVLGLLRSGDLTGIAVHALEDGSDSPSLRVLAGLDVVEGEEARAWFERALTELEFPVPSKRDAVMHLAREVAGEILTGRTDAILGARQIWDLSLSAPGEDLSELDSFVYAASEVEDRPEDRDIFVEGIVAAAGDIVSGR